MIERTSAVMRGSEPAITQQSINGWDISWNPDNDKWYVSDPETLVAVKIYKDRRNALAWARKNTLTQG